jgi:hypothetical protein
MRARISSPLGAGVLAAAALLVGLAAPAVAHQATTIAHKISGTSIAKHSIPGNRLKAHTVAGKQIKPHSVTSKQIKALTWHPITSFENGWVAYGTPERAPAYAVDAQGIVHLRGALKAGTDSGAFTLPASILPSGIALNEPLLVGSSGDLGLIQINGGVASIRPGDGTSSTAPASFTDLEGVTWSR